MVWPRLNDVTRSGLLLICAQIAMSGSLVRDDEFKFQGSDTMRLGPGDSLVVRQNTWSSQDLVETLASAFGGVIPKSKHLIPGHVRSAYEFIKAHKTPRR